MRVQFSSRQLLLATALVALAIGGFLWLRKLTGINPSSETVWVAGQKVDANWQDDQWRPTTGMYLPAAQFASANWHGQAAIKVDQPLLTIAYQNYFGQEVYRANVVLGGHRTDDWLDYFLQPMGTGGGIIDAGTRVTCDQSQGTASIKLVATQYLNSQRTAKRLELVFDRVGDTFNPRVRAEQRIANGAGE